MKFSLKLLLLPLLISQISNAQCTNGFAYATATCPTGGNTTTISTSTWAGDYNTINSVAATTNYESTSSAGDYITIRQGTPGGTVIAHGFSPLAWTSTVGGTYYEHLNTNAACGTQNSSRTSTIRHVLPAMAFGSCTSAQASTAYVTRCDTDQQIIRIEVVMTGGSSPLDLTQIQFNMTGTSNTSDVTNVDIFYTGTSSTYSATGSFGTATPAGGTITVNGTQTLSNGTNYFWIAYDMNTSATTSNVLDAQCTRITVDGSNYTPTTTNPTGTRPIIVCPPAPGGITTNLNIWHKADAGVYSDAGVTAATNGDAVRQWNDNSHTGFNVSQGTSTQRPTYDENQLNYNPALFFDGTDDHIWASGYSLNGNMTHFVVAAPTGAQNDGLLNIAQTSSWNNNAVYLTTRGTSNRIRFVYRNGPSSAGGNNVDAGTELVFGQQSLFNFQREFGGLQQTWVNCSDNQSTNATVSSYSGGSYDYVYGCLNPSSRRLTGYYGEHIKYEAALTSAQKNKVDTYLAVKYGITIVDNYTATDGTTIYNVSSYENEIISIARDDAEALYQKQSHTIDDTIRLYLGSIQNTNAGNSETIASDIAYIVMGDDQGKICHTVAANSEKPAGIYSRLEREWKVTNTDFTDDYNMDIKLATCAQPNVVTISDLRLLVDDDGDFSNATIYAAGGGLSFGHTSGMVTISGISTSHIPANETKYITLASVNSQTPLPVQISTYEGRCSDGQVELKWTTLSEINSEYFEIKKSELGTDWEFVSRLNAAGHSTTPLDYAAVDLYPNNKTMYRLREFDIDGSMSLEEVINVACAKEDQMMANPNPIKSVCTIEKIPVNSEIYILNAHGQIIRKLSTDQTQLTIDLDDMSSGVYFIRAISPSQTQVVRIVKE